MRSVTNFRPTDAGKLQAVINYKRDELGEQELIKQLLEACANIPQPILCQLLLSSIYTVVIAHVIPTTHAQTPAKTSKNSLHIP
jgi:hypothetical protein